MAQLYNRGQESGLIKGVMRPFTFPTTKFGWTWAEFRQGYGQYLCPVGFPNTYLESAWDAQDVGNSATLICDYSKCMWRGDELSVRGRGPYNLKVYLQEAYFLSLTGLHVIPTQG